MARVISISSENVKRQCEAAWKSMEKNIPEAIAGTNLKKFQITAECENVFVTARDEYTQQATASPELYEGKPTQISKCSKTAWSFHGNISFGTLTILLPLRISGQVTVGSTTLDTEHYYHLIGNNYLKLSEGSQLEALAMSHFD